MHGRIVHVHVKQRHSAQGMVWHHGITASTGWPDRKTIHEWVLQNMRELKRDPRALCLAVGARLLSNNNVDRALSFLCGPGVRHRRRGVRLGCMRQITGRHTACGERSKYKPCPAGLVGKSWWLCGYVEKRWHCPLLLAAFHFRLSHGSDEDESRRGEMF